MTYLLTEEEHKAVREAVEIADSFTGGYSLDSPSRITTNKALAILDKLQRVEVVKFKDIHDRALGKLTTTFYAVKETP